MGGRVLASGSVRALSVRQSSILWNCPLDKRSGSLARATVRPVERPKGARRAFDLSGAPQACLTSHCLLRTVRSLIHGEEARRVRPISAEMERLGWQSSRVEVSERVARAMEHGPRDSKPRQGQTSETQSEPGDISTSVHHSPDLDLTSMLGLSFCVLERDLDHVAPRERFMVCHGSDTSKENTSEELRAEA